MKVITQADGSVYTIYADGADLSVLHPEIVAAGGARWHLPDDTIIGADNRIAADALQTAPNWVARRDAMATNDGAVPALTNPSLADFTAVTTPAQAKTLIDGGGDAVYHNLVVIIAELARKAGL